MIVCREHCIVLSEKSPNLIRNLNGQLFSYLALTRKVNEFDIMDTYADWCRDLPELLWYPGK
jgi:hypothetical protein